MAELASATRLAIVEIDDGEPLSEKISIPLTPSMLRAIDRLFHERPFPNRSAAARELIRLGLRTQPYRSKSLT
jgi:Arc/MetJ-type ribon-helix-helix transcriptional regulator